MATRIAAPSVALLTLRSLLWTILFPGTVAGYVPWRYFGAREARVDATPRCVLGLAGITIGAALLAACIFEFARSGRGTLSPADPPRQLVVKGLYRYVRNPMYLSVSTILLGEALWLRSGSLALYWAAFFAAANLFVIGYEEPWLRHQFGVSYGDYTARAGRWLPRLRS